MKRARCSKRSTTASARTRPQRVGACGGDRKSRRGDCDAVDRGRLQADGTGRELQAFSLSTPPSSRGPDLGAGAVEKCIVDIRSAGRLIFGELAVQRFDLVVIGLVNAKKQL